MYIRKNCGYALRLVMLVVVSALFSAGTLFAQDMSVTGKVTDNNGDPLEGVTVVVKGTTSYVSTGIDGNYSIKVPSDGTLQFTFLGYNTVEFAVKGKSIIDIKMEEDAYVLDEAVITAEFGMKRVARAVGSSVQNVRASDIIESGRDDFISALQGRVSGITVTSSGGTPGASTTVVLRSMTSISGNNQPLYVVDGIPMNNSTFNPISIAGGDTYSVRDLDFASRGNDFNTQDIESMTVLKGAAAAVLYGSDASNGAIIITTKKGSSGRGKVSYSNSFVVSEAYGYPEIQDKYANGAYGTTNYFYTSRYGAEYAPGTQLYNNIDAILQTGFSQRHNVSIDGGNDKVTLRASASYLDQTGVIKTSDYSRLNLSLSGKATIREWITVDASLQYASTTNNKVRKGTSGPLYQAMRWPMTDDMSVYMDPDGQQMKLPSLYTDTDLVNPLFALNKNKYYDESDRFLTNFGINITPTKNTFIVARMGWDVGMQTYENLEHPYWGNRSATAYGEGYYTITKSNFSDPTINVLAGFNDQFGKFTVSAQVGYHQMENGVKDLTTSGGKFIDKNFASLANCDPATITGSSRTTTRRVQAISASVEVGWNNMAFLAVRGRNDWSSTLPIDNRSFLYPALEGSFILTELNALKESKMVNYLKLRGTVAQVGKDAGPLAIYPALEGTGLAGGGYKYGFTGPNPLLKPEMTTSSEVGFEGRFLNDRVNMDFTYFWTRCADQYITGFRLSYATGFVLNNMNVGTFTTQGWEFHIDGDIISSKNGLRWNLGLNASHTTSNVVSLPENVSEYYNAYTWNSGNLRNGISVGNPVTTITGKAYARNDAGQILISPTTGIPIVESNWSVLGDREPTVRFGITNRISYKNFTFSALIDGRLGAAVVNGTKRSMMSTGTSWESVELREAGPQVFEGVLQDGLENTTNPTVNTIAVDYKIYGSSIYGGADEDWFEEDVHYVKLQEARLAYNFSQSWLTRATKGFVSTASVWVAGNDLLTFTNYSGIDAVGNTVSAAAGGTGGEGYDVWGIPLPRTVSFGINVTF